LLGDGSDLGVSFSYEVQDEPKGLADAFIVGEDFIGEDNIALVLGDNIFHGHRFSEILKRAASLDEGAIIFGYYVRNPKAFGVVEFDDNGNVISVVEKPKDPKSNYVVPGLYFYDNKVIDIAKNVKPSDRGEIEITSVNEAYLNKKQLKVELLGRGMAWLDTGTHQGLLEASNFVEVVQKRQGFYIACLEEIAFRNGWINAETVLELAKIHEKTDYGTYLTGLIKDDQPV